MYNYLKYYEIPTVIIGTKYDNVNNFVNKCKDGVIWYFDIFGLKAEDLYKTLLQFKFDWQRVVR